MGAFSQFSGPLLKPSPLARKVRKFERVEARRAATAAENARIEREAAAVRDAVWQRDRGVCRAYGVPLMRKHENPLRVGHCHHIMPRSLGGPDATWNEVLISPVAHERAHARFDQVALEVHGDADATLTFVEKHIETGKVLRRWESPVPSCVSETRGL